MHTSFYYSVTEHPDDGQTRRKRVGATNWENIYHLYILLVFINNYATMHGVEHIKLVWSKFTLGRSRPSMTLPACAAFPTSVTQLKWIFVLVVPASPCEMFCFVMRPTVRGVGRTPILQSPKTPRHLHASFLANVWCGVDDGLPIGGSL